MKIIVEAQHSSLWDRGEYVSETEKTYVAKVREGVTRRVHKHHSIFVIEAENFAEAHSAFSEAWKAHNASVAVARETFRQAEIGQKMAALRAIGAIPAAKQAEG